jgi:hypothetical protein
LRRRRSRRRCRLLRRPLWGGQFCPQPAFSRPWPPKKAAAAKIGRPTSWAEFTAMSLPHLHMDLVGTAVVVQLDWFGSAD